MGYSTSFSGSFTLSRALTVAEKLTIDRLNLGEGKSTFPFNDGHCDWQVSEDGTRIEHNGAEKSCEYVESLRWIAANQLAKWGVEMNGQVKWHGEEASDLGLIVAAANVITAKRAKITYE